MSNFTQWKDKLFEATEKTDRTMYRLLLNRKGKGDIDLTLQDVSSFFDILQKTDKTNDIIELKTRWKYSYTYCPTFYLNELKMRRLLNEKDRLKADGVYIVNFWLRNDLVTLTDATNIKYTSQQLKHKMVNKRTISIDDKPIDTTFIAPSTCRGLDKQYNTITYIYSFPMLWDVYTTAFQVYCFELNIPQDIINIALDGMRCDGD